MRAKTAKSARVAILAYPGLSMFEFSVACAIFGPALDDVEDPSGGRRYSAVVCGDHERVRLDTGLSIEVPAGLRALSHADTIVVPPCENPALVSERTLAALSRAHARGARIVSLCTGAWILAGAGLLDGRRAVTHWAECADLAAAYPLVEVDPNVLYIEDGTILTSAGSAASIDLCLHVVRSDHGAEFASALARMLVVAPHRDGGQAQFIPEPITRQSAGTTMGDVLEWMAAHLDQPLSIDRLAERAAMSPRNFARLFVRHTGTTPHQWIVRQRLHRAQRLLETTDLAIDAVAARSGFGDAAGLRKHFRRHVATSPNAYRSSFRRPAHPSEPALLNA